MKKMATISMFLMAGLVAYGDWVDWNVNAAIPDNDPAGLQDTQILSGYDGVIESVQVRLTLTGAAMDYAFNGDFYITLQHDSGFAVLLNRAGRTATELVGYDNNGFDITFTLGGNDVHLYQDYTPSYDGAGRLTGTWGVDGRDVDPDDVLDTELRTDMLESFTGLNPNGNWTIFAADMNLNGSATLDSWGLNVTVVPEPGTLGLLLAAGSVLVLTRRRR